MIYLTPALVLTLLFGVFIYWWSDRAEKVQIEQQREAAAAARQGLDDEISGAKYLKMDGRADALADIKAGHPRLLLYGRQAGDFDEQKKLFRERLGVEVDPLAGCIVSDPLVKYADDYNREIEDFITQHYGPDAKRRLEHEALQTWRESRKKEG